MTGRCNPSMSRRSALRFMAAAAGAAACLPLRGWAASVAGEPSAKPGTAAKSAVQYQDHPKGTSSCANCANFIPARTAGAPGHCTIVAGDISPRGWCLAYAGNG